MKRKWLLPIFLSLFLAVFVFWFVIVPSLPSEVTNTNWRLTSVELVGDSILWASDNANQFTIEFGRQTINGRGTCNSYNGYYSLNQFTHSFSTSSVFYTLVGCLDGDGETTEIEYFNALNSASRYELIDNELHIYFDNESKKMVFEPK